VTAFLGINFIWIGIWSLLNKWGSSFHSSLCARDGGHRVRSMQEKFPFAIFMWVGVESFSNAILSFSKSFSNALPLGAVLSEPHNGLCAMKSRILYMAWEVVE
jgi:hypothetical protein